MMKMMCSLWLILGLAIVLNCWQFVQAEVSVDQTRSSAAYPARGYRPHRRFNLPNERTEPKQATPAVARDDDNDVQQMQARRPDFTYGVPPAARFTQQQDEAEQAQYFFVPRHNEQTARLMAPKSARLAADSEANMDEEPDAEIATDIEVDSKRSQPQPQPQPAPQATTVYYPAGAVSFVQPIAGSFAQPLPAAPQTAAYAQQPLQIAKLQDQPQSQAAMAMLQPQFQAATPASTAFYAMPAAAFTAAPLSFTGFQTAKLQAAPQPATFGFSPYAAYTANPAAFTAPQPAAAPVASAPAAAAAYVQSPYYFTAPAQLQQAW